MDREASTAGGMPMLGDVDRLSRDAAGRTLVMGALNVTPDSFSDGGDFAEPAAALGYSPINAVGAGTNARIIRNRPLSQSRLRSTRRSECIN